MRPLDYFLMEINKENFGYVYSHEIFTLLGFLSLSFFNALKKALSP